MDQGLKERLIGAAVLVAIAVVVVPWVLDGSGERGNEPVPSLSLPVPEQPLPVQRQVLNLDSDTALQPPVPAERAAAAPAADDGAKNADASPQPAQAAARGAGTSSGTSSSTAATPPREQRQAAAAEPARQTASPSSSATSGTSGTSATSGTSTASTSPARRDTAATRPSASAASAAAATGAWQVQLGSFSEEENARRLVQRVATFGYKAAVSTTRSNGRTMYRVRVGPQATREEASAVASSLSAHGFVAQVVTAD